VINQRLQMRRDSLRILIAKNTYNRERTRGIATLGRRHRSLTHVARENGCGWLVVCDVEYPFN